MGGYTWSGWVHLERVGTPGVGGYTLSGWVHPVIIFMIIIRGLITLFLQLKIELQSVYKIRKIKLETFNNLHKKVIYKKH